jgi:23S rRNA pseudouridine955/2504/2580 synthase|tara:strand:+ start:13465 stop:14376 length:912 start_codon:yes stop_codon:yes gene_type:complete
MITITEAEDGQRVDNFLCGRLKGVPKSHVYKIIRSGEVRVNKCRVKASTRVEEGDIVRIPPIRKKEERAEGQAPDRVLDQLRKAVLFEDNALIVLNKPSGLAVHGGSGLSLGLIEVARQVWPKESKLELVHRLDRETSGCLVLARTRAALLDMQQQLQRHKVTKEYTALCVGKWPSHMRSIDAPLLRNQLKSGERVVRVSEDGKQAETLFRVIQHYKLGSLLRVRLISGRTHQIRVHTQLAGHPLAGDSKYGDEEANKKLKGLGLKRLFLHSSHLKFRHPISGELIEIYAPLPDELQLVLDKL